MSHILSGIRPSAGQKSLTTAAETLSSIAGGPAFPQTVMSVRYGFRFSRPRSGIADSAGRTNAATRCGQAQRQGPCKFVPQILDVQHHIAPTSRGEVQRLGANLGRQVCGLQHNLAEMPSHPDGGAFTDASKRPCIGACRTNPPGVQRSGIMLPGFG